MYPNMRVRVVITLGIVLACCARASTLDPSLAISQYGHTVWRSQDVAEDFHGPFTQTADGYFWFGTATGLVRFDGATGFICSRGAVKNHGLELRIVGWKFRRCAAKFFGMMVARGGIEPPTPAFSGPSTEW